jgi:hypothetical protein
MGIELLALYGDDDERMGSFLPGLKKFARRASHLTPQYWAARGIKSLAKGKHRRVLKGDLEREVLAAIEEGRLGAEDIEVLGAFLPGLTKVLKKAGKFTSGITTAAARFVGVPQSALNALAHIDPTKKGSVTQKAMSAVSAVVAPQPQTKVVIAVPKSAMQMDVKKVAIIAGAGIGSLIVLKILFGSRPPKTA